MPGNHISNLYQNHNFRPVRLKPSRVIRASTSLYINKEEKAYKSISTEFDFLYIDKEEKAYKSISTKFDSLYIDKEEKAYKSISTDFRMKQSC